MSGCAYSEEVYGPLENAWSCGGSGGERTSFGTGEGTSLSKALVSLVDRLDTMGPVEMGGQRSVSDGILYAVQDDPADTIREHWKERAEK